MLSTNQARVRDLGARGRSSQHHQRAFRPNEAVHALRSAEPSRPCSACYQSGGRGRRRTLRREDNRIAICPASGWTAFIRVAHYFFNKSRISVRSFTSAVGSGAGAGGSSFFSLLIALMAKNKTPAMIRKFKATVRN